MFSFENVMQVTNHMEFMEEQLPCHHVLVGIMQAATTVNPYEEDGAALVSHKQLWIFAVRHDCFTSPVEVNSLPQCPPASSLTSILEKDGE